MATFKTGLLNFLKNVFFSFREYTFTDYVLSFFH